MHTHAMEEVAMNVAPSVVDQPSPHPPVSVKLAMAKEPVFATSEEKEAHRIYTVAQQSVLHRIRLRNGRVYVVYEFGLPVLVPYRQKVYLFIAGLVQGTGFGGYEVITSTKIVDGTVRFWMQVARNQGEGFDAVVWSGWQTAPSKAMARIAEKLGHSFASSGKGDAAKAFGVTLNEFASQIREHPSLSERIRELELTSERKVENLTMKPSRGESDEDTSVTEEADHKGQRKEENARPSKKMRTVKSTTDMSAPAAASQEGTAAPLYPFPSGVAFPFPSRLPSPPQPQLGWSPILSPLPLMTQGVAALNPGVYGMPLNNQGFMSAVPQMNSFGNLISPTSNSTSAASTNAPGEVEMLSLCARMHNLPAVSAQDFDNSKTLAMIHIAQNDSRSDQLGPLQEFLTNLYALGHESFRFSPVVRASLAAVLARHSESRR